MTVVLETVRALLAGAPPERGRILPACTAEGWAAEAFGEIAIRELFARHQEPLSPDPHVITTERFVAVFDTDSQDREQALLAEVHEDRIARLWRLGDGERDRDAEPALRVAIDPFLHQDRDPVAFDPAEFPLLNPAAAKAVRSALAGIVTEAIGPEDLADRRVIAFRAFSDGPLTAVLAQVTGARAPPRWQALSLRVEGGQSLRNWRVADAAREPLAMDDFVRRRGDLS